MDTQIYIDIYIYMGSFTISGELLSAPQAVSRKDFCCFT